MSDALSEPLVYIHSKRLLQDEGWTIVGGEPPGGSDALPRIEARHPENSDNNSNGSKKVDIIAYKKGTVLLLELKSTFDEQDVEKLDELTGERRWRESLAESCDERSAFNRAGVTDSGILDRIRDGSALVKGIGLGERDDIPDGYFRVFITNESKDLCTDGAYY